MTTYTLTCIVDDSGPFEDFAPYVPSISDAGTVAFQATLRAGGSGIFTWKDGQRDTIASTEGGHFHHFTSHPDINTAHNIVFHATLQSGEEGVFLARAGEITALALTGADFHHIGPLGPTLNEAGDVAFRAERRPGEQGIFVVQQGVQSGAQTGAIHLIADTTGPFSAFQGLPVMTTSGQVVFRADLHSGGQGIYLHPGIHPGHVDRQTLTPILQTDEHWQALGLFPCVRDDGTVAFCGARLPEGIGIYSDQNGVITPLLEGPDHFELFRGVLLSDAHVIFYAIPVVSAPHGSLSDTGSLGIYSGPPNITRILGIGDPLEDSLVEQFALNPVSINRRGQFVVRVLLQDGRQKIVLATPV